MQCRAWARSSLKAAISILTLSPSATHEFLFLCPLLHPCWNLLLSFHEDLQECTNICRCELGFLLGDHRNRLALRTCTTSATNTMHIVVDLHREVVVDNDLELLDVKTSGCNIRRHNAELRVFAEAV